MGEKFHENTHTHINYIHCYGRKWKTTLHVHLCSKTVNTGIKTVKKNNIQDYRWLCLLHLSTLSPRCIAFSLTFCTKCWFHKKQESRQQGHAPGHAERYRPVSRHVPDPPYNTQVKLYTMAYTSIPKYPTIYMPEHILVYPNALQYTGQSVY